MNDTIIVAIIGAVVGITGYILTFLAQRGIAIKKAKKADIDKAKEEQKKEDIIYNMVSDMKEIKDRLDEHNNYAKIFASVDKKVDVLTVKVESNSNDLKDLREQFNGIICCTKK